MNFSAWKWLDFISRTVWERRWENPQRRREARLPAVKPQPMARAVAGKRWCPTWFCRRLRTTQSSPAAVLVAVAASMSPVTSPREASRGYSRYRAFTSTSIYCLYLLNIYLKYINYKVLGYIVGMFDGILGLIKN